MISSIQSFNRHVSSEQKENFNRSEEIAKLARNRKIPGGSIRGQPLPKADPLNSQAHDIDQQSKTLISQRLPGGPSSVSKENPIFKITPQADTETKHRTMPKDNDLSYTPSSQNDSEKSTTGKQMDPVVSKSLFRFEDIIVHDYIAQANRDKFLHSLNELSKKSIRPTLPGKTEQTMETVIKTGMDALPDMATICAGTGSVLSSQKVIDEVADNGMNVPFVIIGIKDATGKIIDYYCESADGKSRVKTYDEASTVDEKTQLEAKKKVGKLMLTEGAIESAYQSTRIMRYVGLGVLVAAGIAGAAVPGVQIISPVLTSVGIAQCIRDAWKSGRLAGKYTKLGKIAERWLNEDSRFQVDNSQEPMMVVQLQGQRRDLHLTKTGQHMLLRSVAENIVKLKKDKSKIKGASAGLGLFYGGVFLASALGAGAMTAGIGFAVGAVAGIGLMVYILIKENKKQNETKQLQNILANGSKALNQEIKKESISHPELSDTQILLNVKSNALNELTKIDSNLAYGILLELVRDGNEAAEEFAIELGLEEEIEALKSIEIGNQDYSYKKETKENIESIKKIPNHDRKSQDDGIDLITFGLEKVQPLYR